MRAVFLDGMGTLLDLPAPWTALVSELRRTQQIDLPPEAAERAFRAEIDYYRAHHMEGRDSGSLAQLRTRCAGALHSELPQSVAARVTPTRLREVMLECLRFNVYPEVSRALEQLRERGMTLIVVSNWDVSLHGLLHSSGLASLLDGIVTSAEVGQAKPSAAIFEQALDLAGVAANEAMHVGDSPRLDVQGASRAGLTPVLVRRAPIDVAIDEALEDGPTCAVISSLQQLPSLVDAE